MNEQIQQFFKENFPGYTVKEILPMKDWKNGKRYAVVAKKLFLNYGFTIYEQEGKVFSVKSANGEYKYHITQ